MKKILFSGLVFLFVGCGLFTSSSNSNNTIKNNTVTNNNTTSDSALTSNNNLCISVYTLGNVVNAVVKDNNNQIAAYDENSSKYCFQNSITYPITITPTNNTFIDVDYDNKKTANDIIPKFSILKSYYPFVDVVTTVDANAIDKNLSNDSNTTFTQAKNLYENQINDKYNINLSNSNIKEKILNFVFYDANLSSNVNINTDLFDKYNALWDFFNTQLNIPSIKDKVKYYSFFHSLELLNIKLIQRVDTIHRPIITYLHENNKSLDMNYLATKVNVIVKDIKGKDDDFENFYVASGFDGIYKFDKDLQLIKNIKVSDTFSNMYELNILDTQNSDYVIGADGGQGLDFFDINGFNYKNKILWKYFDVEQKKDVPISIDDTKSNSLKQVDDIISVKTYVSPYENKMWLAFGSKTKGMYLVDLKKIYPLLDSNVSYPIITLDTDNDKNNTLWITGDGGEVFSEAFSNDGQNLYATKSNTIERYDLSSLVNISTVANTFQIKGNNAYKLLMITHNSVDELFVSTDKGVEVYDVLNNGDLNFISSYNTEGSEVGYYPKMTFISDKNILLFTDGYKGLKAIKYDSSFNPKLCGVSYFYPSSDNTKLGKVTAVYSYKNFNDGNYYVLVGVEGFGLIKFNLRDLLFKHCLTNY